MKLSIVTGGNSGIGFETAKLMASEGYNVTITGRNEERVSSAAKTLSCSYCVADMANLAALENVAKKFEDSGLDALVLNAAAAMFKPISDTDLEDFNYFIDANIRGSYFLIKWLLPALIKNRGAITIVTSAVVENGLPNASIYALTKGAMDSLAKSLAAEFADNGVRINVVAPGAVDTPILHKLGIPDDQVSMIRNQQEAMIPLRRYARPQEVAQVILAQLQSTYVTGATWEVDGGVNAI